MDNGILICVGVGFGSMGGSGMVEVGLKVHLSHTLNFEAIPCTKTYFWWWFLWWWCGIWFLGFDWVWVLDLL